MFALETYEALQRIGKELNERSLVSNDLEISKLLSYSVVSCRNVFFFPIMAREQSKRKSVNRSRTYDLPIIKYDALPCIERMKTPGSKAIEQWFKW